MTTDLATVEAEVGDAVARSGLRLRRLRLISPLGERKGMRYAYRVETEDGRTVKARHFGTASEAQRIHEYRLRLEDAFAPVIARSDAVLIEAWLEGEMVDAVEAEARAQDAGGLLGRLHALPLAPGVVSRQDTTRWNEGAAADIDLLRQAQVLTISDSGRLATALQHLDPGSARVALVHKDFCAENMLIDTGGRLRIIDTELLSIDPIGFDLAWTWYRWPMTAQSWARFIAAHRSAAPCAPEAQVYWRIVTGLMLARVFFQRMPERLDVQLDRLRQCLVEAHGEAAAVE